MTQLHHPLRANGTFSLASGALLLALPSTVADWLGIDNTLILRAFGVALLSHAAVLFWAANRPDPRPLTKLNLLAIAPYPLAMIALIATGIVDTPLGRTLVLIDGFIIASISAWHLLALRQNPGDVTLAPA